MPQINKGGKFIFGKSLIRDDLTIHPSTQTLKKSWPAANVIKIIV